MALAGLACAEDRSGPLRGYEVKIATLTGVQGRWPLAGAGGPCFYSWMASTTVLAALELKLCWE